MKISLIDIGSNLTHASFDDDLPSVLARAVDAGVARQIVTGADLPSSQRAAELALAYPEMLWSTAGVHPHHAASFDPPQYERLLTLVRQARVVAVGECGLDFYRDYSPRDRQRTVFIAQLELAVAVQKPVFLHQRDAHADFLAILKEYRGRLVGGVAHCFTGGRRELEDYLALDLFIGVTGWVNDERRGHQLREAVPHIPSDRLMVETDAPYLLPRDLLPRPPSRRNEPCYLPHIARTIAELRGESLDAVAASSTRNATSFFTLKTP
jgi:TatD DNase family protein